MPFKITNVDKKTVAEVSELVKVLGNGKKIYFSEEVYYRWGEVIVEEDPRENGWVPGSSLITDDFSRIDHDLRDGCWSDKIGIDDLSKKEQKLLEEAFYPEDAGWEYYDSQIIFHGDVEIEEVE